MFERQVPGNVLCCGALSSLVLLSPSSQHDRDGCARYVVTDVTKDGTLAGPNIELLKSVCAATKKPVVASGGISSLNDIAQLAGLISLGVEGAIVGKALYAGAFTLEGALKVANQ